MSAIKHSFLPGACKPVVPRLGLFTILIGACAVLAALATTANAQTTPLHHAPQFDKFKGDGYYWYNIDPEAPPPPKEEPPKPPHAATPSAKATETPKELSTQWLRESMPKLLDKAIDDPSKENVANYMYAQRVLLDKAQTFSQNVKEVVAMDPFLDENNRIPMDSFAQGGFARHAKKDQDEVLSYIAKKGGLWVFLDSPDKCTACSTYVNSVLIGSSKDGVSGLATQFKFDFKAIYVNTPEGKIAAKKLNLKVTPTTVLVVPPNGYYLVSQGLMSQDRLQERVLLAAKTNGMLSKDLVAKINPYDKGLLTNEQMTGVAHSTNPTDVMDSLRKNIKGE